MTFTNEQISKLVAALPGCVDAHRRKLLPRILKQWSQTYLEEHFTRSTPKQIRAERQQIDKVAKQARELARALSEIESHGRFAIACKLHEMDAASREDTFGNEARREAELRLSEEPEWLELLANASIKASTAFIPLPLRHSTLIRYLILQDLAAICEWATRRRAGRRVKTDISVDAGKTYGPFWDFTSTAWPMIFGSGVGLSYSLKTWAGAKKRYKEVSPIIWNLDLRHPEWRIREVAPSGSAIRRD